MMVKTTVNFMTENGEHAMTFHTNPQEFDKTLIAMQTLTGEKDNYVICNEDGDIEMTNFSINFRDDYDEHNWSVRILNFLIAAGAHSTLIKAIQLGTIFVIMANICVV